MRAPFATSLPILLLLGISALMPLRAQLAITEVMSSASTNLGISRVGSRSDFWELTNFGTNAIDLSDYRFNDEGGVGGATNIFNDITILGGESIIFAQEASPLCTNAAQFKAWWGEANLPTNLQVFFYTGHGFSAIRDAVQLWHVTGVSTTLVQRVELYEARRGFTFEYDITTGLLDELSTPGDPHVFKAAETDDFGSAGYTRGAVPLALQEQPRAVTTDLGASSVFRVRATGLPVPTFQWLRDGSAISGATSNELYIPVTLLADAGSYSVQVANGLTSLISSRAVLTVSTLSNAPVVLQGPADLMVTPGQTAVFTVLARGYPLPTFLWSYNGVAITGETNRTLRIVNASTSSAGSYSIHVQNQLGSTNANAALTVRPKPKLVITEMMGGHSLNTTVPGHADWWELTNFDTNAVNLRGYRFDDNPGILEGASAITNDVVIAPGESVLFIQDMSPEAFTSWWGEENLPENVQFIPYHGNGIQSAFDLIRLWNPTALDDADYITEADYVNLNPDFTPVHGTSLTFWCEDFLEFGQSSVLGECGGIRAVEADDIGSPGYINNHPVRTVAPRFLNISRDNEGTHLVWKTQNGIRYELLRADALGALSWTSAGQYNAAGTTLTITDPAVPGNGQRFYRLQILGVPQ